MAKTSWINRNERKRQTVKKYAALRAELKAKKDYLALSQLAKSAVAAGPLSAGSRFRA
jgi:small subunit ribosomal protein S14